MVRETFFDVRSDLLSGPPLDCLPKEKKRHLGSYHNFANTRFHIAVHCVLKGYDIFGAKLSFWNKNHKRFIKKHAIFSKLLKKIFNVSP